MLLDPDTQSFLLGYQINLISLQSFKNNINRKALLRLLCFHEALLPSTSLNSNPCVCVLKIFNLVFFLLFNLFYGFNFFKFYLHRTFNLCIFKTLFFMTFLCSAYKCILISILYMFDTFYLTVWSAQNLF